jgi:hypothetical protein
MGASVGQVEQPYPAASKYGRIFLFALLSISHRSHMNLFVDTCHLFPLDHGLGVFVFIGLALGSGYDALESHSLC